MKIKTKSNQQIGISDRLEKAVIVDGIISPLEENIENITLESLHQAHGKLKNHVGELDQGVRCDCPHCHRFVKVVKRRANYIASRGWFIRRLEEGIEELEALRQFLPKKERKAIDHEIAVLQQTHDVILEGREETGRTLGKQKNKLSFWEKIKQFFEEEIV